MKQLMGLTVIILLFSLTISAQQKQQRSFRASSFTPEQMATLASKKMTLNLDLDKNQEAAVFKLMKQHAENRQSSIAEIKKRKESGTKPTNEEKFQMLNARLDERIAQKYAMKNILSNEQFEKWEKSMHSQQKKMQQHRGKMKKMKQGGQKNHH